MTPSEWSEDVGIELFNPDGLPKPEMYRQVSVATGSRTVYLSGQVARNEAGEPVGAGDVAAQSEQALINVDIAIRAVGGTFEDIAKLTVYVVDLTPEKMEAVVEGAIRAAHAVGVNPVRPVTMLGISALGEPDLLVEVEAVGVLP